MDFEQLLNTKEDLHEDLVPYIIDMSFGKCIHHPLIISTMHHEMFNSLVNQQYIHKLEAKARAEKTNDFLSFLFLHERPYRLEALMEAITKGIIRSEDDFNSGVRSVWVDSENIHEFYDEWLEIWRLANPEKIMTKKELSSLAKKPEVLTIYRGLDNSTGTLEGMSWTVNKAKAKWFARRFSSKEPIIAISQISKKCVRAYLTERNEFEIVVNPDDLEEIKVEELASAL